MEKPTPEQIQRACDLANGPNDATPWFPGHYGACAVITALADTIAKLDAMQAERDKARADLGEIYIQLDGVSGLHRLADDSRQAIEAAHDLAAPYRVETDPLLLEAREIAAASDDMVAANVRAGEWDNSHIVQCCLAALKRGLEIGRAA